MLSDACLFCVSYSRPFINDSLHAHTGISASAEALLPAVQAALERGRSIKGGAFRDYKVVVTGHSLGECHLPRAMHLTADPLHTMQCFQLLCT